MRLGISGAGRDEITRVLQRGRRVVTVEDAARALSLDGREAAKRLARWATMGWLRRVRRGLYIPVPVEAESPSAWSEDPLFLADAVWAPCYFTGWTAASHWGLTEQIFRTTVLKTAQRVRRSRDKLLDHQYLLVHLPREQMWGVAAAWRQERRLQMADATRTVIDILDQPMLGGGIRHASEILKAYLDEHDGENLIGYAERLGNRTIFKRLGYLVEALGVERRELVDACRARLASGVSLLEPGGPANGTLANAWGLRVNVRILPAGAS